MPNGSLLSPSILSFLTLPLDSLVSIEHIGAVKYQDQYQYP